MSARAFPAKSPPEMPTVRRHLRDLNTFPNLDNAMAHQRYLEQLSFETHFLHQWSRMIGEQINDELATILDGLSQVQQVNAWTRLHPMGSKPIAPPPPQPHMVQMQMQPPSQKSLQVKPAPLPRTSGAPASSSASSPPPNQPFSPQQRADPRTKTWNMHR